MKYRILIVGAVALLCMLASAWAADVTGKWTAQVPGRQGTTETTFNFKVEGNKVTGTVVSQQGDMPISDGKIEGDTLTFTVVREFNGNQMKLNYKGTVAGDEIKFTREMQMPAGGFGGPGGGGPGPGAGAGPGGPGGPGAGRSMGAQEFVAKRAK
jgi:hypothetical protein